MLRHQMKVVNIHVKAKQPLRAHLSSMKKWLLPGTPLHSIALSLQPEHPTDIWLRKRKRGPGLQIVLYKAWAPSDMHSYGAAALWDTPGGWWVRGPSPEDLGDPP